MSSYITRRTSGSRWDIAKTRTHAFILISSDSPVTSEVQILDASEPLGEFRVLLPRVQGVEYDVTHHTGDRRGRDS